jgi:hypothetical protein
MADPRINLILGAKDDASKVVKGLRGQFDQFKRDAMAGFGLGAGISVFGMAQRALGGVVDVAGDAINAASDLEESQGKVDQVFGDSAETVHDWADEMSASYGLTRQEAEESAGTFGNFTKALGLADDEALEVSTSLTTLAGDLSSFNNIDVSDVLVSLRSGLAGEAEPMRRLGVDVSAARIETILLAKGIEKTNGAFTEGQKVLGRYEAIMEDTALAQGDAERTAGTLAGQQRRLRAEMGNALADIGAALTPVAAEFTRLAAEVIPAAIDATKTLGGAVSDILADLDAAATGTARMSTEIQLVANRMGVEEDALLSMINALRVNEHATEALRARQEVMGRDLPSVTEAIDLAELSLYDQADALDAAADATEELSDKEREAMKAAAMLLKIRADTEVMVWRFHRAQGAATDATEELTDATDDATAGFQSFLRGALDVAKAIEDLAAEELAAKKAAEELAAASEHVASTSFDDVKRAANEMRQRIIAAFKDPIPTIKKLEKEERWLNKQRRRAMRLNRFDIVEMIDARKAEIAQQIEHRRIVNAHHRKEKEQQAQRRADLKLLREKFNVTKKRAIEMWKEAGKDVTIAVQNEQARRRIEAIRRRLAAITGVHTVEIVTVHTEEERRELESTGGEGGGGSGRQVIRHSGGIVQPGQTAIIRQNEAVLTPAARTNVVPLDGQGGNVYLDGYLVGRVMDERMGRQYGGTSRVSNYRRVS